MSDRPQNIHPKMQWLDIALAGQPADTKAQVLDFCVKFGVDGKDDDFWILIAAIGFLHAIVKSAPETWQQTFETFHLELQSWSKTNLNILSAIADQAEANAQQATLTRDLITTLNALTQQLAVTKAPTRKDDSNLMSLSKEFLDFREAMTYQMKELKQALLIPSKTPLLKGNISNGRWNAISNGYETFSNPKGQNDQFRIGTIGWLVILFLVSLGLTLSHQEGKKIFTPENLANWLELLTSNSIVLLLAFFLLFLVVRFFAHARQHYNQQTQILQAILERIQNPNSLP